MNCFANGGRISQIVYNPPYWDDLRVPLTGTNIGPANDPPFLQFIDNGSGSTGVYAHLFSQSIEQDLFFSAQMPHGWLEGSTIKPHIHWFPTDSLPGTVRWGLEYTKARPFTTMPNSTILTVDAVSNNVALQHQISGFGDIAMAGDSLSTMIMCRVFRDATDAADTYGNSAGGLEVDFHYQLDTPGSRQEFIK